MFISMMENINVRKTPVEHVDGFIKETIYLLICLFLFIKNITSFYPFLKQLLYFSVDIENLYYDVLDTKNKMKQKLKQKLK